MVLLAMDILVALEPGIDDLGEAIQLRSFDRPLSPVAGWCRERQYLVDTVTRDVEMTRSRALAHAVGAGQTNLQV